MALIKNLIPESQYSTKCPYPMQPKGICIHNTGNNASAKNERDNLARHDNRAEVSFHIAIDDEEAVQCIPFTRNAWASGDGGNGEGNRCYIHTEICYSLSGGDRFIKAEKRAAKEVAALLKQYGWGIDKVKKHQDFSGKYCPHRTLDLGWERFINMIKVELEGDTGNMDKIIGYTSVYEDNNGNKKIGSLNTGATVEGVDYWSTLSKIRYGNSFAYVDTSALESRAKKVSLSSKVYEDGNFTREIGIVNGVTYIVAEYSNAYKIYWNNVWGYVKKDIDLEKEDLKKKVKELENTINKIKSLL
ncbi:N-acetylmuramoyl-L-alanine amidase [uncultured Clostridium sp.]|uniref:peptidoglycan recognition protein family protein n=1 Tax=uncultured Clostridium sp. TaxID=59620 RepID=UPI0025D117DA|nr:N-acetylmuramoyl-L-alanine amidase [uncultured Clostridium sp.]